MFDPSENEREDRAAIDRDAANAFDFSAYPADTVFHERREGRDRRDSGERVSERDAPTPAKPLERRAKKERRRRIDPTTFEKQYTDDEMEFMNAMQRFKVRSGKAFPSVSEVLRVAYELGYRKVVREDDSGELVDDGQPDIDGPASLDLEPTAAGSIPGVPSPP